MLGSIVNVRSAGGARGLISHVYHSEKGKNKAIRGKPCSCLCYFMDLGVRP